MVPGSAVDPPAAEMRLISQFQDRDGFGAVNLSDEGPPVEGPAGHLVEKVEQRPDPGKGRTRVRAAMPDTIAAWIAAQSGKLAVGS